MSYFWNVVCPNLFSDVTYSVSCSVTFFQGCDVLLRMDYIKGIGGVEIYGFGTVSIVRMPCISAFF